MNGRPKAPRRPDLAKRVRTTRMICGWSQEELARRAEPPISYRTVADFERTGRLSRKTATALAAALATYSPRPADPFLALAALPEGRP